MGYASIVIMLLFKLKVCCSLNSVKFKKKGFLLQYLKVKEASSLEEKYSVMMR